MGEEGGGKEEEGWWWQEMGNSQTFGYYWCKMKWNEHLQDEPTYENVSNISYLDSCIREALRCYPPIPTSVPFAHPSLFSPEITAGLFSFVFWKTRLFWWIARCRGVTWHHWRALTSFTSGSSFFTSFFFCCPSISAYISSFLSVLFFASFLFFSIFLLPKKTIFVESARVLLFPCVSSHWWVHFLRSVLSLKGVPILTCCAVSGCKDQFDFFWSRCW